MATYTIRKILSLIPMMLVISFLIYLGIELMPGDAVDFLIPPDALSTMSAEQLDQMRNSLGLNDPFVIRYVKWLTGILHGDFGYSLQSGVPVAEIMRNHISATIELSVAALIMSSVFGILLGVISALKKGSVLDHILDVVGMIGVAIPQFLFGLICINTLALHHNILPVGGRMAYAGQSFIQRLPYLILPATVLGFSMTAGVMRYARGSMLESMGRDYMKTARSKGIPEWRVNLLHGLRAAVTPVVVLIGFRLPMLIGGAVVVEEVFQWPGIGGLFIKAVRAQNTPLVMMIGFFSVLIVLVSSILVDLVTAMLDPRIKLS
ncbi:peptide/nickel transport system permease protein [Lacrimispora sphenoides]|jgi:peptide/nickel transport system permease protein|uniref:ABC transporter permease n=1 Tax=Lacrimispora sphenoides TaxID=29370 RepID=UPI0008CFC12A|nr:ABC transporter permease [Lacrimispora sphenoides]SEU23131.1 peptide/nickel transport system permease protein [Lacrimispora sphenoides]